MSPPAPPAGEEQRPPAPAMLTARQILFLAVWAGLVGGLGEVARLAVGKFGFHLYLVRGLDVAWTAPVSLVILCTGAALPFALLAGTGPLARHPAIPLFVLGFLALLNVMPTVGTIHPYARLLLVAGLVTPLSQLAARRSGALLRLARRTMGPLLALVTLLAVAVRGGLWLAERRALAALPPAAAKAPNVILLILDTVRAMDLNVYGYGRPTTPRLQLLGERGVIFDRAYAPSSWTLASHAAIFTGHRPSETGVDWTTPFDGRYPTLAELLARRGYATAGFAANPAYVSRETGMARGFAHFEDYPVTPLTVLLVSTVGRWLESHKLRQLLNVYQLPGRKSAGDLKGDVMHWLDRRPAGKPFFVFVNYFDAHVPYLPPPPYDTAFTGRRTSWRDRYPYHEVSAPVTPLQVKAERDAYDQAIAAQDAAIGGLFDALETRGLLQNTIVVVSSDHGEEFGEWGLLDHGNSLYPAALLVPLVVVFPGGLPGGGRIASPISLLDLPATILRLADPVLPAGLPGTSLLARGPSREPGAVSAVIAELQRPTGQPDWYPISKGPLRSVTRGSWHYIRDARGGETLLEVSAPAGRRVALETAEARAVLPGLRASLDSVEQLSRANHQPAPAHAQ